VCGDGWVKFSTLLAITFVLYRQRSDCDINGLRRASDVVTLCLEIEAAFLT